MKQFLIKYVSQFTIGHNYTYFSFNVISNLLNDASQLNAINVTSDVNCLTNSINRIRQTITAHSNHTCVNEYVVMFNFNNYKSFVLVLSPGFNILQMEHTIRSIDNMCPMRLSI